MLYFFTIFIIGSMLVPETEGLFRLIGGIFKGVHKATSAILGGASHAVSGTLGGANDVSESLIGWGEMNEAQREEAVEKMLAQE